MKLYKIRFIVLGLLLRVFFVWCQTCGTKFTDPASSAYLAEAVVEGKVSKIMTSNEEGRYNVTLVIRKVRKGDRLLPKGKKTKRLTIGEFGEENLRDCVTRITKSKKKYFFFLKKVTIEKSTFYRISAFPVSVSKQTGRLIKKAACKTCGKKPELKKIKAKNVQTGRRLQLRCRLRSGKPDPTIVWTKDGVPISGKTKGVQIKKRKKYLQLRINKASSKDAGVYRCIATNVVGTTAKSVNIKVFPKKTPTTKRPAKVTTSGTSGRYIPCRPEDQGYCLNGGTCRIIKDLDIKSCACRRSYYGERCAIRTPDIREFLDGKSPDPDRDRTLTIIGIVIGILIFVCFCIASYFLAKNRRMAYLKRKAKNKQLNGTVIPYTVVDPPPSGRMLHRQNTVNMETQTEDGNLYQPFPNTNQGLSNAYLNPLDSNFLRNPPANRNSRTRLSGVSMERERPTSQPETMMSPKPLYNRSPSDPTRPSLPTEHRGDKIPRLFVSDESVGSDGEEGTEDDTSLRISEDDERTPFVRQDPSESGRFDPDQNYFKNDDDTLSQRSPCVDDELRRIYCGDDNDRYDRRCSETLSWNERGSPEQCHQENCFNIEDPMYIKSSNCIDLKDNPVSFGNNYSLTNNDLLDDKPSTPV